MRRAAEVRYQPRMNSLSFSGADARGGPSHGRSDFHRRATIDVACEQRQIDAVEVKTTLNPQKGSTTPSSRARQAASRSLDSCSERGREHQRRCARVSGHGRAGRLSRRREPLAGRHGDPRRTISLDQEKGSLVATGSASSTLELDTGLSVGLADEIRYDDDKRLVTYSAAPIPPTLERGSGSTGARSGGPDAEACSHGP